MRSQEYGVLSHASNNFSREQTLEMAEKMCTIRYFEEHVKKAHDAKLIKCPIYLSLGQEAIPAALSTVYHPEWKFIQHRGHGTYLAYGGNKEALVDELLHRSAGCARGMGGSASIHDPAVGIVGHDGHMGTQVPIAVGHIFGRNFNTNRNERAVVMMGDASAEEDWITSALGFAAHKQLPMLFVCEDNNLSILTPVRVRRNWNTVDVARGYGLRAVEIADDPWTIMQYALLLQKELPAYMNIHTARAVWHAGTGSDGAPEWDRFSLVKEEMHSHGLSQETCALEERVRDEMNNLWKRKLEEQHG